MICIYLIILWQDQRNTCDIDMILPGCMSSVISVLNSTIWYWIIPQTITFVSVDCSKFINRWLIGSSNFDNNFANTLCRIVAWAVIVKLLSGECHRARDVSLMFLELSKIFSQNLCFAEFVLPTRILSCNFVHKHFQLEILTMNVISSIVYFQEIVLESSWNISETTSRLINQHWFR